MTAPTADTAPVVTPEQLREHWQGHRRLTRRVIEAFPDDQLASFSIGGMRPFAALAREFLHMGLPTIRGVVTGEWKGADGVEGATTKADLLRLWDEHTVEIDRYWAQLDPKRFQEVDTAFGQWTGTVMWILQYIMDNEIHHRGQGYVYLRALGIEPPHFWERG